MAFITEDGMINTSLDELNKEEEYLKYLDNHIGSVQKAYKKYFKPLLTKGPMVLDTVSWEELMKAIKEAETNIADHDASKYGDEEFIPYRQHFYPTAIEKSYNNAGNNYLTQAYEEAWKHHYHNNPHHSEYWINEEDGTKKDMELKYIIEMICDWNSFEIMWGDSTEEWFNSEKSDKERHNLTPKTLLIVKELLYKFVLNDK